MKKSIAGQALTALFTLLLISAQGCLQVGNQTTPTSVAGTGEALSGKSFAASIGGVALTLPLPTGYAGASSVVRQASEAAFTPPENIFGVYTPTTDKGVRSNAGLKPLQNRRLIIISARPELVREAVGISFYQAMQRDFTRDNGVFAPERIAQFKVLTGNYYARDDAFAHKLGVYAAGPRSTGIVRIVRQAASEGEGATSVYSGRMPDESVKLVLEGWDQDYFSQAYHKVHIQNVVLFEGRCFNIHFFAPLASETDIYAAMRENREYMEALAVSLAGKHPVPPGGADEAAGVFTGMRLAEGN